MKVLLVDDHPLIQDSAATLLRKIDTEAVLLSAASLNEALRCLESEAHVDLVLLDLQLPDSSGLNGLATIKQMHPATTVVVLSATEDPELIRSALNKGASGYIPKSSTAEVLRGAIELVLTYKTVYVPLQVLGMRSRNVDASTTQDPPAPSGDTDSKLKELGLVGTVAKVFEGLIEAKPLKVIARDLGIAESTVKAHARTIYFTLRTRNRAETLLKVAQMGIVFRRTGPEIKV